MRGFLEPEVLILANAPKPNAMVLPEPVRLCAIISWPSRIGSYDFSCIHQGQLNHILCPYSDHSNLLFWACNKLKD